MSCKEMGRVLERLLLPPREKLVALALANYHNDELGKAWPSQETLCRVTGLSRSSIDRAVRDLKKRGIVRVTKERGKGARYAHNVYRFNHASSRDMDDVHASGSSETTYQKQPELCVQEAHYPLSTLTDPLEQKSKNKTFSGPPKTPEQFWKCGRFERQHIYLNKPCLFNNLKSQGLIYDYNRDKG